MHDSMPSSSWIRTYTYRASGFSKDQLKVQVEPSGSLKVSGERAVDGGGGRQWCHFTKRFHLPAGCGDDAAAITVQLDKGMLYVQVPRPAAATSAWGTTEQPQPAAEMYEEEEDDDALRGEDETGGDDGWNNVGRVAARRRDGEHPLRRLARGLSRHRQVLLNVVLAVVLLWLVAFANNKPGGGQAIKNN